jgi:hypothetical protein
MDEGIPETHTGTATITHDEVIDHSLIIKEGRCLKGTGNSQSGGLIGPQAGNFVILKKHFSLSGKKGAGDKVENSCFSCSIGAYQTEDLTGLNLKTQVHHCGQSTEETGQPLDG